MGPGAELTWQAAAAANILEARKRNGRVGTRKSRTGCLTCKSRRIKCDEQRPECQRCISTGRTCDGYASIVPRKTNNSLIGGQLSQTLGLRNSERRTFDYFLSWTAPRLAGPMDKFFWCSQVLQLAQTEPVVVNSLLAISTLYEHPQFLSSFHADPEKASVVFKVTVPPANRGFDVQDIGSPPGNPIFGKQSTASGRRPSSSIARPPLDHYHANALRHYNRAIQAFRNSMDIGHATPHLALISCVLFICIEIMRDSVFEALKLLAKGLDLLKQISANPKGTDQQLLKTLKPIFGRLGLLAAIYGYPLDMPQDFFETNAEQEFTNLEGARTALWALMLDSHTFIRDAAIHMTSYGYEEPQDPTSFRLGSVESDPIALTRHPILPDTLGVPANEKVTRLYVGCLPEDNDKSATSESNNSPSALGGRSFSSPPSIDSISPLSQSPSTDNTFPSSPLQGEPSDLMTSSPLFSLTLRSNVTDSPPPRLTDLSTSLPAENMQPLSAGFLNGSGRGSWWAPLELLERQDMLENRLKRWHDALHRLDETDEEATSSLLSYYHLALIWLKTRLLPQTAFDFYTFHFEQILHLAEIFIKSKGPDRPTFTFEIGVLPQLYFLVTKCRVPSLRRKCLDLMMKAPRKESTFGSKSCAELAARLVAIEEEGLGISGTEADDSILPPEENRVQNYQILQDNVTARYEVRVTRYHVNKYGRQERTITDYPI